MLTKILILAAGGAIGTVLRYGLSGVIHRFSPGTFPYGTMAVNLTGCLMIGLLWGVNERLSFNPALRMFLFIGLLGGFTTFSSFGLETFNLLRDNELKLGLWNILLNNFLGITLVVAGFWIARAVVNLGKP
jgi:CrcB protein